MRLVRVGPQGELTERLALKCQPTGQASGRQKERKKKRGGGNRVYRNK